MGIRIHFIDNREPVVTRLPSTTRLSFIDDIVSNHEMGISHIEIEG